MGIRVIAGDAPVSVILESLVDAVVVVRVDEQRGRGVGGGGPPTARNLVGAPGRGRGHVLPTHTEREDIVDAPGQGSSCITMRVLDLECS